MRAGGEGKGWGQGVGEGRRAVGERNENSGIWRGDEGRGGGQRLKARGGCGLRVTVGGLITS